MQEDKFPPNDVLGNSEGIRRARAELDPGPLFLQLSVRWATLSRAAPSVVMLCSSGVTSRAGDQVCFHGAGVRPWRRITSASAAGSAGPPVAASTTAAISRK